MKPTRPTRITDVKVKEITQQGYILELYTRKNGLPHLVLTIDDAGELEKMINEAIDKNELDSKQS